MIHLQFWKNFPWQRNTLFVALAGMEMSWLAALVMSLHQRSWDKSPWWYLLGLSFVMLVMMTVANYLSERQVDSPAFELGVLSSIVLMGLLVLRLYVFWGEPLLSLRWLNLAFIANDPRRVEAVLVLLTMAFLWWRGVSFLQREISFFSIGYDFRKGVLLLVLSVALYSAFTRRSPTLFVYSFFFFSLIAVAVGRAHDKATTSGGVGRPFGPEWTGILALGSAVVLVVAALFSNIWSLQGFRSLGQLFAPTGSALGRVLGAILLFLLRLLDPLLQLFLNFVKNTLLKGALPEDLAISTPPSADEVFGTGNGETWIMPGWMDFVFSYVIPVLLIAGLILVLVFWLDRGRRGERQQGDAERSKRVRGQGGLLQAGFSKLRELAGLVGQFGLGRSFYAAISARNIYANLQHLADDRGYPRHRAQTPSDYLPTLDLAFPGQTANLQRLTDAYNAVEYGQAPTDDAELAALRSAWDSLRQTPRPIPPAEDAA